MSTYLVIYVICVDFIFQHNFPYFFFFNDTATTEIYTLSLHDALPIFFKRPGVHVVEQCGDQALRRVPPVLRREGRSDRKSTRLNSSHPSISYAVFCLKKKTNRDNNLIR